MLVLQGATDGVLAGGFYALMAAGLTIVFGVMEIINVAQGILVVLGAYLSYELYSHQLGGLRIDPFLSLLITIPFMFLIGYTVYYTLLRPIKNDRGVMSLLVMFAVGVLIEGVLDLVFSSDLVQIHTSYADSSVRAGPLHLSDMYLYSFAMSVVLLGSLYLLVYRTRFGRSLRATVQNPVAARMVGINTDRVAALTFGVGTGLAAAGGMVFGSTGSFNAASSYDLISRLLAIVILAGLGSLGGALAAAMTMLVIEDVVAVVISPTWASYTAWLVLVIVLAWRWEGLAGRKAVRAQ